MVIRSKAEAIAQAARSDELAIRQGRGAGAAVQTLPVRDQGAIDAFPGIGAHARPVHPEHERTLANLARISHTGE